MEDIDQIEEIQVVWAETRAFIHEMISMNEDYVQRAHQIARANRALLLRPRISE